MLSPDPIEHATWRNAQLYRADYESRASESESDGERAGTRCLVCMEWKPVLRGTHVCVDCDKEI